MREISLAHISKPDNSENVIKAVGASFEKSLAAAVVAAVKEIKPADVNVSHVIQVPEEKKEPKSYLVRVHRDGHGRVESMVLSPYEPS